MILLKFSFQYCVGRRNDRNGVASWDFVITHWAQSNQGQPEDCENGGGSDNKL